MLLQGIVLLVAGIGIVLSFLTVLIAVLSISAKIVPRFNHILPDEAPKAKNPAKAPESEHAVSGDEAVAVAVAAAALRHRASR
jgi:sodium pump decarboxylase gamma subunit